MTLRASPQVAEVPRLHPVRVGVIAADGRFRRVSRLLLARAGFEVETAETARNVFDLIARCRINVAVIDATNSVTAAARTIAALGAVASQVKVVAVAEHPDESSLENLRLLPKWSHWQELVEEIEDAYAAPA